MMEWKRIIIVTLVCVLLCKYQRIWGKELKMRVKPGDNVTLFGDCVTPLGFHVYWIRNESYGNQSSLLISVEDVFVGLLPRISFVFNSSSNSYDLHIENISVSDEGIYYCAKAKKILSDVNGRLNTKFEYQYGNRRIHLTVLDQISACTEPPNSTTVPTNTNMNIEWTLLVSVCPVCVLLCCICICCLCRRKKNLGSKAGTQAENRHDKGDEVYYASLNTTSIQQKQLRNTRLPDSDLSTYSEVRCKRPDC